MTDLRLRHCQLRFEVATLSKGSRFEVATVLRRSYSVNKKQICGCHIANRNSCLLHC